MSSLKSSSRRSSSSMSFHSSARYSSSCSSSSSYRRQGPHSPPGPPESPEAAAFLDQDPPPTTGVGPQYPAHLIRPGRAGGVAHCDAVPGCRSSSVGPVHLLGDTYYTSAQLGRFDPPDIAIMAYSNQVVIHAEKVMEDGSVSDTFTQKAMLPDDMDPLSVRGTLSSDGVLVVSVQRTLGIVGGGGGGRRSEPVETQPSASNFTFDPRSLT